MRGTRWSLLFVVAAVVAGCGRSAATSSSGAEGAVREVACKGGAISLPVGTLFRLTGCPDGTSQALALIGGQASTSTGAAPSASGSAPGFPPGAAPAYAPEAGILANSGTGYRAVGPGTQDIDLRFATCTRTSGGGETCHGPVTIVELVVTVT